MNKLTTPQKFWITVLVISIIVNGLLLLALLGYFDKKTIVTFGQVFRGDVSTQNDLFVNINDWAVLNHDKLSNRERIFVNTLLLERVNVVLADLDSSKSCSKYNACVVNAAYIETANEYYVKLSDTVKRVSDTTADYTTHGGNTVASLTE